MKKIAVVLAGGRGSRMNSDIPKQYLTLKDRPVLYYALKAFQDSDIDSIVLAAGENDLEMCRTQIVEKYGINKVMAIVAGGAQRYDTVYNALKAAQELTIDTAPKEVLIYIHDGARPCISQEIIKTAKKPHYDMVPVRQQSRLRIPLRWLVRKDLRLIRRTEIRCGRFRHRRYSAVIL